ncbi:MAG: 16S rRNA (adenine(1518)-N(6)/adenine(1519)-N(6))-dimethyltransferase RsmA [Gemmatimonadales bacterium]
MRAKKRLGQHFLPHRATLARIADALAPTADDAVLEIGPGHGSLTAVLLERTARVTAIEKDGDLVGPLRERFPALRLVHADALDVDWRESAGVGPVEPLLVVGNIPYNVTSPLLDQALTPPLPTRIVFLVQREVADRLAAEPGTGDYGSLTVGVQSVARVERLFTVPAGAFVPPPRVDSAVVRLTPLAVPLVTPDESGPFRRFVVALFGARRKQLARGLRTAVRAEPAAALRALESAGIAPTARPETLAPAKLAALYRALVDGEGLNA